MNIEEQIKLSRFMNYSEIQRVEYAVDFETLERIVKSEKEDSFDDGATSPCGSCDDFEHELGQALAKIDELESQVESLEAKVEILEGNHVCNISR